METIVRKSKPIKDKEIIDTLLKATPDDICQKFILDLFGEFGDSNKCNQWDTLTVPPGSYKVDGKPNKNQFTTSAGNWLFNLYFISPDLTPVLGYINEPISSKVYKKINKELSYALMEDRVSLDSVKLFLEKTQGWMAFCTPLTGSWSEKILSLSTHIEPKKKELLKKYEKELKAGDIVIAEKVQKELLAYALDYLGNDPGLDGFLSGAGGSLDNNFMSMYIMKGAIRSSDPNAQQEYSIASSNYMDGITPDEYSLFAESLAPGPASRALKTASGGYWEKLMISAHQHLKAMKKGSDCGTTLTKAVFLTKSNIDEWIYSYMVIGGKLVELNSQNMNKYIGKLVKFRYSALCKSKNCFCNACLGNYFYKQNIINVGLNTDVLASKLKNICMKFFHDSSVVTVEMNLMEAFSEEE